MNQEVPGLNDYRGDLIKSEFMRIRHRATGKAALGIAYADGTVLVQFNDIEHPHGHGWSLYPRHHFHRRRGK